MSNISRLELLLASFILSLGLACAGYFIGQTLYNSKVGINTAEVKGLAERRVEADRAYWRIQYRVTRAGTTEMSKLYEQSETDQARIISLLLESGFEQSEISLGVINYERKEFRDRDQRLVEEKYVLVGSIDVETKKVKLVSEVRSKLNRLIAQGLDIQNNEPAYYFTKL
ncbi:MAG: SIMPL domain-containing protein, partial [Candidatus Zixiibacteriota bacterium]